VGRDYRCSGKPVGQGGLRTKLRSVSSPASASARSTKTPAPRRGDLGGRGKVDRLLHDQHHALPRSGRYPLTMARRTMRTMTREPLRDLRVDGGRGGLRNHPPTAPRVRILQPTHGGELSMILGYADVDGSPLSLQALLDGYSA
jgi:hypothetical protein